MLARTYYSVGGGFVVVDEDGRKPMARHGDDQAIPLPSCRASADVEPRMLPGPTLVCSCGVVSALSALHPAIGRRSADQAA